ncbi:MAG: rhomboid family intramembrane serine protease [Candidatus Diapherotrites archaeon]|nr:rhomboid family intramembrane serine protease [Candidatus Diapherotrites archaeon]
MKKLPLATLGLCALTAIIYFLLSGGQPYVHPLSRLDAFGVTGRNLIGAASYAFIHIGLKHMLGNIVVLLGVGTVLESRIGSKDALCVYLISAIGSGFFYALLHPNIWVVGASAAVSGLIAASFITDFKKTVVVLVACIAAVPLIVFPATDTALDAFTQKTVEEKIGTITDINAMDQAAQELEEALQQPNLTQEEAIDIRQQLDEVQESLEEKQQEERELALAEEQVVKGRQTEAITPVSMEIHFIGMACALAYMYAFKRKAFTWFKEDVYDIVKPGDKRRSKRTRRH